MGSSLRSLPEMDYFFFCGFLIQLNLAPCVLYFAPINRNFAVVDFNYIQRFVAKYYIYHMQLLLSCYYSLIHKYIFHDCDCKIQKYENLSQKHWWPGILWKEINILTQHPLCLASQYAAHYYAQYFSASFCKHHHWCH